ncbi:hypothetical protein M378DRAFT_168707 [Amanita muscaria Koide BX008]|uniref:Uncharacterized protein n=1 Tax=Amanita muscaria (strain Koide BX008) TaxID=946122 RepID=A0A0C2T0I9_AMAMK|nr:hypothetical protein M378DRAFT_168707 [Amanita muscaria Koide BX008]
MNSSLPEIAATDYNDNVILSSSARHSRADLHRRAITRPSRTQPSGAEPSCLC